jgi:hypothetical protein
MFSEERKNTELIKKVADAARNERNSLLIIPMGIFLVSAGLILCVIRVGGFAYMGGIVISLLGLFSTLFGFYVVVHYAHRYNSLARELEGTQ